MKVKDCVTRTMHEHGYPGPRVSWQILRREPLLLFLFYWHEALRTEKRKPLVKTVGILTFIPSAFDRRVWLEDIFNCSTSHMIGWIKYLLGCDWSKENDILDSCQVLSQHESEILHDLDQRLSFSPGSALRSALHVANFQIKKKH